MRKKQTYEYIYEIFNEKGCKLLISKDNFNHLYKNYNSKLKYMASCGHEHEIQFRIFKNNKNDAICPNCVFIKRSNNLKQRQ